VLHLTWGNLPPDFLFCEIICLNSLLLKLLVTYLLFADENILNEIHFFIFHQNYHKQIKGKQDWENICNIYHKLEFNIFTKIRSCNSPKVHIDHKVYKNNFISLEIYKI
jgi:hypothetical protein